MCHACLRGLRANMLACQHGLRANVLKACQLLIFTCQRANKRFNVPYGVPVFQLGLPMCQTACQFFNLGCQRAKRRASFSNIALTKYLGKFLYFILDIIVIHIICTCIIHKNCIILHFYISCQIKKKACGIFLF